MSLIIGIGGGSGSGKTTLANEFESEITILHQDDFFKNGEKFPQYNGFKNMEHPSCLNLDLFYESLDNLKNGNLIEIPIFDLEKSVQIGSKIIEPTSAIIVEGFNLYLTPKLRSLYDVSFFLRTNFETQYERRKLRDFKLDRKYFDNVMVPMYRLNISPTIGFCDYILDGEKDKENIKKEFTQYLESYLTNNDLENLMELFN